MLATTSWRLVALDEVDREAEVTPLLKKQLEETGLFQVDVVTAPPAGGDFAAFKPDFSKYAVVVWNYDAPDERWPAELEGVV